MSTKKKVVIGLSILIAAVLIIAVSFIIPRERAIKAHNEYVSSYDGYIDSGDYQGAVDAANTLMEKHDGALNDREKEVLNSRIAYARAIELLNITDKTPSSRINTVAAITHLKNSDGYGISDELLSFYNEKGDLYDGNLTGTLTVDHSKYVEKKEDVVDVEGTSYESSGIITFERGGLNSKTSANHVQTKGELYTIVPVSGRGKSKGLRSSVEGYLNVEPSDENDDTDIGEEEKEKQEDKPTINEYECTGFITTGFKLIDKNKGVDANNIKQIAVVHASVVDTPKEKVSTTFDSEFDTDKPSELIIMGTGEASVEKKSSFENGVIKANLGNGTTLELKIGVSNSNSSSNSSSSNNSASSGAGTTNPKDYSPGSEWEQYDADKDGRISDEEFQNATKDHMDKYYDSGSQSNKDYSEGSEWEKYDSDKDGTITDKEFQNATGDYIDKYFEEHGTGGDLNAYDYNGNQEMENNEFQDAVGDYMEQHGY